MKIVILLINLLLSSIFVLAQDKMVDDVIHAYTGSAIWSMPEYNNLVHPMPGFKANEYVSKDFSVIYSVNSQGGIYETYYASTATQNTNDNTISYKEVFNLYSHILVNLRDPHQSREENGQLTYKWFGFYSVLKITLSQKRDFIAISFYSKNHDK